MINCVLSKAVSEKLPTLSVWLKGAWLNPVIAENGERQGQGTAAPVHILLDSEIGSATHRDILVSFRDDEPRFVPAGSGLPARVEFGFEDMAFAHALIAELVRAGNGPAVGEPATARQMDYAVKVARSEANVLIQGETGTGKEGMARFVHDNSPRAKGSFVAVNCAALPDTMVEAILFGHKKGAFTGATAEAEGLFRAADGGTLFLDEITELPLPLQAKLLRALQEGEILPVGETRPVKVDVRIISAANRNCAELVEAGDFREDLYWRLNVMPIEIAALRDRRQDVRAIAATMLISMQAGSPDFAWPSARALDTLQAHGWPGNARELGNVLQRALVLRDGDRIATDDLGLAPIRTVTIPRADPVPARNGKTIVRGRDLHSLSRAVEHDAIQQALDETGGNRRETAKLLGISERTLRYRLASMREMAEAA
ncbi:MAG: sigma-54 dependent transcriptional regulator [Blastomonas sp.]